MNILVTGAAGFLGRHIATTLSDDGHRVYGLLHDNSPFFTRNYRELSGNILDYARMLEIIVCHEIDLVYHCAAKSIVRNCVADPLGCLSTNVLGTATVLEACRQSGRIKGVMCMESDKAYGASPVAYTEDTPLRPTAIYETSKACVSHLVATYWHNYDLPVFGVRSANLYGPYDPNRSRLVPHSLDRIRDGKMPQIVESAEEFVREFLFIDDAVSMITSLMAAAPWGQSVNIGSGITMKIGEAVNAICLACGVSPGWIVMPRSAIFTEIESQSLCCDYLRRLIGDTPCTSFADGIARTVAKEIPRRFNDAD
jgi:dTDP-glucose 4,6-dehydratase